MIAVHCQGPECDAWQAWGEVAPDGWIGAGPLEGDPSESVHFCSWRCMHNFAGERMPAGLVFEDEVDTTTKVPRPRNAPRIREVHP